MTRGLRPAAAALVAVAALSASPPVQAQQIVHDARALVQMIEDARTSLEQLRALQAEVEQSQRLFDSLNTLSDVNRLAQGLGLPEVRSPLPDLGALRAAADGDLDALGRLADRANEIRRDTRRFEPPTTESFYLEALERAGARTARDLAIGEAIDHASDQRREGLETLRGALTSAPNARAVLDLQARLAAEQALIGNEQVRLQGLALTQAAETRLEEQRAREEAQARRAARLRLWERNFQ